MTLQKDLRNRIRGWFPHDINLVTTKFKENTEKACPPLIIPADYNLSSTKYGVGLAVFWAIIYGYMFFTPVNLSTNPISLSQAAAFIILGIVVSATFTIPLTKQKLEQLKNNYQSPLQGKELFLPLASAGLLFLLSYFASLACQVSVFLVILFSVYTWSVAFFFIKALMFVVFERKENMRIMQSWFLTTLILIPKAPNSEFNQHKKLRTKLSASIGAANKSMKNELKTRGWFPTNPSIRSENQTIISARKASPTLNDRLVGGLGAAGGGLILQAIIFSFIPEYPKQVAVSLLFVGIPLLVAAFLIRIKYKR